jgi:hypothetical protein
LIVDGLFGAKTRNFSNALARDGDFFVEDIDEISWDLNLNLKVFANVIGF